jgi:preprotein translocase subunit SecE
MKKMLLMVIGTVAVFSSSLCTLAEQEDFSEPKQVTVNYINENVPQATVKYIPKEYAQATVRYIKSEYPQATVHFLQEDKVKLRKVKNRNRDEVVSSSAIVVDAVESGTAVAVE